MDIGDVVEHQENTSDRQQQKQEKQRANELAKILNKKLIDECISIAKEIANNSFTAVKTALLT